MKTHEPIKQEGWEEEFWENQRDGKLTFVNYEKKTVNPHKLVGYIRNLLVDKEAFFEEERQIIRDGLDELKLRHKEELARKEEEHKKEKRSQEEFHRRVFISWEKKLKQQLRKQLERLKKEKIDIERRLQVIPLSKLYNSEFDKGYNTAVDQFNSSIDELLKQI